MRGLSISSVVLPCTAFTWLCKGFGPSFAHGGVSLFDEYLVLCVAIQTSPIPDTTLNRLLTAPRGSCSAGTFFVVTCIVSIIYHLPTENLRTLWPLFSCLE